MFEMIFSYTGKLLGNILDDHILVLTFLNTSNQRLERIYYAPNPIKTNENSLLSVSGNGASHWSNTSIHCIFTKEKWNFFLTWNKYEKAAQTGRQDSTHKSSF